VPTSTRSASASREVRAGRTPRRERRGWTVLEAIMAGFVAAVAVGLFLVVLVGLGAVAFAVRRDEPRFTLVGEARPAV
jgi:hypothetical protein